MGNTKSMPQWGGGTIFIEMDDDNLNGVAGQLISGHVHLN